MRLKNLVYLGAALFLLAACTSGSQDAAATSGDGASSAGPSSSSSRPATKSRSRPPVGFTITPGSQQDLVVNVGDRVFFEFDQSNLKPGARTTLEKQAAWLKKFPAIKLNVEGHADERGTREYNLALGERRANSAKDFLVALGISPNRLRVISFGKERPVALGNDDTSWSQNRRSVSIVTGGTGS